MARKLKSDKLLFLVTLLLVGASVVMVYSASAVLAMDRFKQPYLFLFKQITWATLGVFLLALMMRIDYRNYKQPVVIWTALGVVVAALVAVLFSPPINGTRRWFAVANIGVQPSELAKMAAILFTAAILERRMDRIDEPSYALLPIGAVVGLMGCLILLEPDFGTAVSLALVAGVMIFAAGINYRYLAALFLALVPALYIVLMSASYRRRRMLAFLNPWSDPLGDGFQIIQSLIAVGGGGVFGRGLMGGIQKLFYLPEPHTDFIYAVISEELGLIGATAVLICFVVITWRGLRIASRAPDRFGAFLALGLTMMMSVQAFVNISVVLSLLPTKGIPLPFVSAGGSSLLINLLGMGMLLNISQHASSSHA
ncbi:MAG: putative lipid II flippase FtsW [Acidobacteria bacterium]|nr:putative lipid II flippase FtsW [Acidobacteriota bacterium]